MPFGQHGILALRRQLQVRQFFRRGTQSRRNEDHPLRVNSVDGTNRFVIHPVERCLIMVELIRRFINQVKTQKRRTLTKVMRHRHPPVHHLFFITGAGVLFIFIRLVSNNRDYAILLAGFDQLAQMNQSGFCRFSRHANAHMGNAFRPEIPHHQRIELADATLGSRPIYVHPDPKLLCIRRRRQRRLRSAHGGAGEE